MSNRCESCMVRDRALCAALAPAELAALSVMATRRTVAAGEALFRAGDEPLLCATLQSGVMKLSATTAGGEEAIVGLLFPGDFIGRPFTTGAAGQDVVALTEVQLCSFPRARFEAALAEHPRLEALLLGRTLAELDRTREWLLRMGRASAGARVAGFLEDMVRRLGVLGCTAGTTVELPLSRGEMAALLGLTIETVSRQMTRLQGLGAIALRGGRQLMITAPALLAAEAGR